MDYETLFRQQKKVAVGMGFRGKGLFTAESIGRDELVIESKGERTSATEGKRPDKDYAKRGWLDEYMLAARYQGFGGVDYSHCVW